MSDLNNQKNNPLFTISKILHFAPSKVEYTGLTQALNGCSLQSEMPFIKSMRGAMEEMTELFDTIPINKNNEELKK